MRATKSNSMNGAPRKTKISVTLTGWDAQVLEEACSKLSQDGESNRTWIIKWAIRSFAAALLQKATSRLEVPCGVELTAEDPDVSRLRMSYGGDGPTGLLDGEAGLGEWFPE